MPTLLASSALGLRISDAEAGENFKPLPRSSMRSPSDSAVSTVSNDISPNP